MAQAQRAVELAVQVDSEGDGLRGVLSLLTEHGVSLQAYSAYCERDQFIALLVPTDPARAKALLEAAGYSCKANRVVLVGTPKRVGAVAEVGSRLGQSGVRILYSYATAGPAAEAIAVFKTSDDERALQVLRAVAWADAA